MSENMIDPTATNRMPVGLPGSGIVLPGVTGLSPQHSRVSEITIRHGHTVCQQLYSLEPKDLMQRFVKVPIYNAVREVLGYADYMMFRASMPFPQSRRADRHMRPVWVMIRYDDRMRMVNDQHVVNNSNFSAFQMVQDTRPLKDGGNIFNSYIMRGFITDQLVPGVADWDPTKDNFIGGDNYAAFQAHEAQQYNAGRLVWSNVIEVIRDGLVPAFTLQSHTSEEIPCLDWNHMISLSDEIPGNGKQLRHPMSHPPAINMVRGMVYADFDHVRQQGEAGPNIKYGLVINNKSDQNRATQGLIGAGVVLSDGLDRRGASVILELNDNNRIVDVESKGQVSRARALYNQAAGKPVHLDISGSLRVNDPGNSDNPFAVRYRLVVAQQQIIGQGVAAETKGAGIGSLSDLMVPMNLGEIKPDVLATGNQASELMKELQDSDEIATSDFTHLDQVLLNPDGTLAGGDGDIDDEIDLSDKTG